MSLLKPLYLIATLIIMTLPASAQSCVELCKREWWLNTSDAEIKAVIATADVNADDEFGITPLMSAASYSNAENVIALLNAGADVNFMNGNGGTALIHAAASMRDNQKIIKILLDAGAELNGNPELTNTPLMFAAGNGTSENVMTLLSAGAEVNATDPRGSTALIDAMSARESNRKTKILLDAGAEVNIVTRDGATALLEAAFYNNTGNIIALLGAGADITHVNSLGNTALAIVAAHGNIESVRALLDAGADVNTVSPRDDTPLMFAASSGSVEIVMMLLDAGADAGIREKRYGNSALDYAFSLQGTKAYARLQKAQSEAEAK